MTCINPPKRSVLSREEASRLIMAPYNPVPDNILIGYERAVPVQHGAIILESEVIKILGVNYLDRFRLSEIPAIRMPKEHVAEFYPAYKPVPLVIFDQDKAVWLSQPPVSRGIRLPPSHPFLR